MMYWIQVGMLLLMAFTALLAFERVTSPTTRYRRAIWATCLVVDGLWVGWWLRAVVLP